MRIIFTLLALASVAIAADTIPEITWDIECENPSRFDVRLTSGEEIVLKPQYRLRRNPLTLTNATTVALQFRLAGSTNAPYELPGTIHAATNGKVRIVWPSSNVVAAGTYSYRILVRGESAANMRGFGNIIVGEGFGVVTGEPPAYVTMISSNEVAGMIAAIDHVDPTARAAASTATDQATNALALAQSATGTAAAVSAALVAETNRAIQAESGINTTATNALTIGTNALAIAEAALITEIDPYWSPIQEGGILYDEPATFEGKSVDWKGRTLYHDELPVVVWSNYALMAAGGLVESINWEQRYLKDTGGVQRLSWSDGSLAGAWTMQIGASLTGTFFGDGAGLTNLPSTGGGASGATNYAAWVSSLAWREVSGVYTSGSSCAVLAAAVTEYDEAWSVLFTCTNAQQVARLAAPASGAPLDATQAVVRASWWVRDTDDVLHVWPSWSAGSTNTLTAISTNAVQIAVWTNTAGSGSWFLDARVTGNDGAGRTALPQMEVIWQ